MDTGILAEQLEEHVKIKGHLAQLSDNRLVFLARKEGDYNTWFLAFKNDEGGEMAFKLSNDAMDTLVRLYNKPMNGTDIFPLQLKVQITEES